MLRSVLEMVSPGGKHGKLTILIFHRVLSEPDPLFPFEMHASRFDQICGWIKSWFRVLPLDKAVEHLKGGTLPARSLAITFDDGYADNYEVAAPILKRHGLSATFFIATGYLDGGRMWNDTIIEAIRKSRVSTISLGDLGIFPNHPTAIPLESIEDKQKAIDILVGKVKYVAGPERDQLASAIARQCAVEPPTHIMMKSSQVIAMRQLGMGIGAHTVSHPILATLDASEVRREISESKTYLESLLQEDIKLFAYPNGKPDQDYLARDPEIIRELGFDAAFTTAWGAVDSQSDMMQLPRFTPWDRNRLPFGSRLIRNLLQNNRQRHTQVAH